MLPFGAAYAMSYALRTINAVLAPAFVDELSLSASELGLLTSAYFLAFALMQIPLGSLLDRYGPRRVESSLLLLAVLGCLISAVATAFWQLWVGRALIGIGVSACLMASYKAYRMCFDEKQQAPLASVMLTIGSLGALSATLPVEWLLTQTGWREIFWLLVCLFLLVWAGIRYGLAPLTPHRSTSLSLWQEARHGFERVATHPEFWRMMPLAVITYGGFLAVHGLWLGPWFTRVEGYTPQEAATALFWLTAVIMLAHFCTAWLSRHLLSLHMSLNGLMVTGLALMALLSATAIAGLWPHPMIGWSLTLLMAGVTTLSYTRFALAFPKEFSARATTGYNFLIFFGAFVVQWGLGLLIDLFMMMGALEPLAMRLAFACWVAGQVFALYWLTRPERLPPEQPLAAPSPDAG